MNEKTLSTKDQLIIASIAIISLILFSFIIGDMLGIVCLLSNHTLAKTLFGIFLFFPATFILVVALLFMSYGVFHCFYDGRDTALEKGSKMILNSVVAIFFPGIFILVTDVIFLKVPFGIHLLFSYCFLLLLVFSLQVYRGGLAIPENNKNTQFIALFIPLLEQIIPKQDHEEWMGLLKIGHDKSIKEGKHLIFVNLETLKNGLCLIGGSLWLKADKFVSGWMTRAK
ncbi:MAG: hypothetical protein ACBR13_07315 [Microcoleus sp.]